MSESINYVNANWHVSINIHYFYQLYFSVLCINVHVKYFIMCVYVCVERERDVYKFKMRVLAF